MRWKQACEAFERAFITEALRRNGGRIKATAREIGMDRNELSRRAKKHGVDLEALKTGKVPEIQLFRAEFAYYAEHAYVAEYAGEAEVADRAGTAGLAVAVSK